VYDIVPNGVAVVPRVCDIKPVYGVYKFVYVDLPHRVLNDPVLSLIKPVNGEKKLEKFWGP
jgi:hypothetical protein